MYESWKKIFKKYEETLDDFKIEYLYKHFYQNPDFKCFPQESNIFKAFSSLNNIKKLLLNDTNIELKDNSLEHWAKQGILLLNCSLTVFEKQPGCHLKYWKNFIDYIISELNKQENIIFIAWGAFAYKKLENKHIVLTSSHPSPLSCNKKFKEFPTFMESNVFSKINKILESQNQTVINW